MGFSPEMKAVEVPSTTSPQSSGPDSASGDAVGDGGGDAGDAIGAIVVGSEVMGSEVVGDRVGDAGLPVGGIPGLAVGLVVDCSVGLADAVGLAVWRVGGLVGATVGAEAWDDGAAVGRLAVVGGPPSVGAQPVASTIPGLKSNIQMTDVSVIWNHMACETSHGLGGGGRGGSMLQGPAARSLATGRHRRHVPWHSQIPSLVLGN